jgi:hypothetical protein
VRDAKDDSLVHCFSIYSSSYGIHSEIISRLPPRCCVMSFKCSCHPDQIDQAKLREYENGPVKLPPKDDYSKQFIRVGAVGWDELDVYFQRVQSTLCIVGDKVEIASLRKQLADAHNQIDALNDEASQRIAEIAGMKQESLAVLAQLNAAREITLVRASERDSAVSECYQFSNELIRLKQKIADAIR